ncbi:MAG TPA: hypothetical protein VJC21_00065 [Candidatus Nanoarchaeia archaeon]|nr:hypothetical protein [Candidatus Nanoarchaeia archaeon]
MRVTIDTKEDTHEDIRKVLHLLAGILEKKEEKSSASSVDTTNLMGMFGDDSAAAGQKDDKAPDFGSFLSLTKGKEEKKGQPLKIEFF